MTNHEHFTAITGVDEPVHIESFKMVMAMLSEQYPECDFGWCLKRYKAQIKWLNGEVCAGVELPRKEGR